METYINKNSKINQLKYLRISVTDKCNLKCLYCKTKEVPHFSHDDILRYEEINRLVKILTKIGISKVRITGGEPLIKRNIETLISLLLSNKEVEEVSLTTNGILLSEKAKDIRDAGIKRLNISLDTLDKDKFRVITGYDNLNKVIEGIDKALELGFYPIKINTILLRGINDNEILNLINFAKNRQLLIRFIEYMPIGNFNKDWFISIDEIKQKYDIFDNLVPIINIEGNGPAKYYLIRKEKVIIGLIAAITNKFCNKCNRLRLSCNGKLKLCLEQTEGYDLKYYLRNNFSDDEILSKIQEMLKEKGKEHHMSFGKESKTFMYKIGG